MDTKRRAVRLMAAAGLLIGIAGDALAAGEHAHSGHGAAVQELKLNNGTKWQTDAPLQKGMEEIRAQMTASLDRIHHGTFALAEFEALGSGLERQIEYITENCRLPEEADAQLHLVLADVIEGIEVMKGKPDRAAGAVLVVNALAAYGRHFEHPGWQPLAH